MNDSTLSHDLYHFSNHLSDLLQGTFEQADEITPPHHELLLPIGSKGNAAAMAAITIYNAAQMYIGTGVLVFAYLFQHHN
jgi:hypothetical protein